MIDSLNLPLWAQELVISLAIIVAALIVGGLSVLILKILRKQIADRTETELDDKLIDALRTPVRLCMILIGLAIVAQRLEQKFPEAGEWVFRTTDQVIVAVIIVIVAFFLVKIIRIITDWYGGRIPDDKDSTMHSEFSPLVNRVVKVLILVLAALTILSYFKVDIKGLVAVLGVGSLAIALAAQDTISNMISGFIIMMDRPFRKGDRVLLPSGEKGDVYEIGLRSTKFLTFEHTLVIVPNQELVRSTIINLTYPYEEIRVKIEVGVAYGSSIEEVKSLLISAASEHPAVLSSPPPVSYFVNFGDSSLDFTLVCRVSQVRQQWRTSEQLRCTIYDKLNEAGIEIPFPQRVVYLQKEEESTEGKGT